MNGIPGFPWPQFPTAPQGFPSAPQGGPPPGWPAAIPWLGGGAPQGIPQGFPSAPQGGPPPGWPAAIPWPGGGAPQGLPQVPQGLPPWLGGGAPQGVPQLPQGVPSGPGGWPVPPGIYTPDPSIPVPTPQDVFGTLWGAGTGQGASAPGAIPAAQKVGYFGGATAAQILGLLWGQ
jgi:hypothetical protein